MPTQDIGELGPSQGQATVFPWKWYYGVQGLLVWAGLGLAMLIPKANRDRKVLLILIPVAVASAIWFLLLTVLRMSSAEVYQFGIVADSLVVGVAVLWLLAPGLGRFRGIARFLLALCLMCAVAGAVTLSSASASSAPVVIVAGLGAFVAMLLLSALAVTARQCRKDYHCIRFLLGLGSWTVIGAVMLVYGYILVVTVSSPAALPEASLLARFGLVGLLLGLFLYLLSLPYVVLALVSPFYRARMQTCLRVPPRQEQADSTASAFTPL